MLSKPRTIVAVAIPKYLPNDTALGLTRDNSVPQTLSRLDALARLMDSAFRIPGTEIVMGFDALIGLVPVIGDAISSAIGGYIIWEAKRLGVSRHTIARMAANTTIDTVLGSIPILGDVFDVVYKSNRKNVALLKAHIEKHGLIDARTIETSYSVRHET